MVLSFKDQFVSKILDGTKIHTVREDKPNRWKEGNKIHFATGVRTKSYNCFKEDTCISTQRVLMTYAYNDLIQISIGGKELYSHEQRLEFVLNDGFEDWESFFNWFYPLIKAAPDETYIAKVIHWTDKRYPISETDC